LILISLSGAVAVAIMSPCLGGIKNTSFYIGPFLDTHRSVCYLKFVAGRGNTGKIMNKNSKVFDIIVLAGMVVNIILAVFLILYYFDFL
jgi:hypothetical protein